MRFFIFAVFLFLLVEAKPSPKTTTIGATSEPQDDEDATIESLELSTEDGDDVNTKTDISTESKEITDEVEADANISDPDIPSEDNKDDVNTITNHEISESEGEIDIVLEKKDEKFIDDYLKGSLDYSSGNDVNISIDYKDGTPSKKFTKKAMQKRYEEFLRKYPDSKLRSSPSDI